MSLSPSVFDASTLEINGTLQKMAHDHKTYSTVE